MNRQEFLRQLAQLLEDVPAAERKEALDYYNSYFDDAGPENEAFVIQELGGDPKIAAASLKAEFQSAKTGSRNYGEYTENGYRDNRIPGSGQMPRPVHTQEQQDKNRQRFHRGSSQTNKIIWIVLIILTSGIWLGILGGLIGLVFSLLGGAFSLIVGMAALVIALAVSGVSLTVLGIVKCFTALPLGLLAVGFGLVLLAAGLFLMVLFLWLAAKLLPGLLSRLCGCLRSFCSWCKMKWAELFSRQ